MRTLHGEDGAFLSAVTVSAWRQVELLDACETPILGSVG
jgi:hypothetical protein